MEVKELGVKFKGEEGDNSGRNERLQEVRRERKKWY